MVSVFDGNDMEYQKWLSENPGGYVLNARRSLTPSYMVLHSAGCYSIRRYTSNVPRGGFTERSYVKVCAPTKSELSDWVRKHGRPDGSFSNICSFCV